jgi:SanA protein
MKRILIRLLSIVGLGLSIGVVGVVAHVQLSEREHMKSITQLETAPIAMILGASVKSNGTPSDALRDRLDTGIELYQKGIVQQLLLTGDDGGNRSNEITVMRDYVRAAGIPDSGILVDGKGYRTYESCKQARHALDIDRAIIVTQRFHLARALYLCSHFDMDVQGIAADKQSYQRIVFFWLRDFAASFKAWWDVSILPPSPPVE